MKTPQLYIKNEKGRYEPYKLTQPDISDTVYRKINGKYEPIGIFYNRDYLTEGIWVVYNDHAYCNGKYLKDRFTLEKTSNITYPEIPLSELGGIMDIGSKAIEDLYSKKNKLLEDGNGISKYDEYMFVINRAIELLREKQK